MKAITAGAGIFRGLRARFGNRKQGDVAEKSPVAGVKPSHANIEVTPGDGSNRIQFLDVKNLGKEATFHAEGQIISSQNSNSFVTGAYPLGWGPDRDAWVAIPKGDTRKILIASVREIYAGSLFHMALIESGPSVELHWARWNAQDKLPLPRFGLKVSIIAEGAEEPWTGYFSVTPENQQGTGIRMTFRGLESRGLESSTRLPLT